MQSKIVTAAITTEVRSAASVTFAQFVKERKLTPAQHVEMVYGLALYALDEAEAVRAQYVAKQTHKDMLNDASYQLLTDIQQIWQMVHSGK